MKFYYITFRSVTFAQRAEQLLQKNGIRSTLLRTPRWMEVQGCGYSLRLWTNDIRTPVVLLRRNQVNFQRVYIQIADGTLEEIEP